MATNKLQWKRIAKGDRLPCDSLLMKKDGTIPSVVSGTGVKVGQDAYYLSVEELKSFPKEENENEKTKRLLHTIAYKIGQHLRDIFTEEEYQCYDAWSNAWREKQGEQKHQYNSRPRYVGEEELLGTNKQGKCPFSKQELIDMGFAFTQDGDLAYPIHKIENKEFAAWNEEDEDTLRCIIDALDSLDIRTNTNGEHEDHIEEIYWLKALKDRVLPQPKQEWSEEDEQLYNDLSDTYFYNDEDYPEETYKLMLKRVLDWMNKRAKFLRPQSHWKPSEEHYELEEFAKIVRGNLTGISKAVQKLFEAKYLQLTGNKMYGGFKD
jgi:hypothetical protein